MLSTSSPRSHRTRRLAAIAALCGVLVLGGPGIAEAKGGGGKGKPGSTSSTASQGALSAPSSVAAGTSFTVTGTGFAVGGHWMKVETSSSTGYLSVTTDATGSFSVEYVLWTAGPATFTVGSATVTVTAS